MAGIKKLFADAAKLLYLGVGISDPGTIPRKVDLWKIAEGEGWKVFNLSASVLNHKGKEAVRLKSLGDAGLALFEDLELSNCKLDLSIAAVNQAVGLIVRAEDENSYELVSFDVDSAASKLAVRLGERSAEVALPLHLLGEWIAIRVVVAPQFTAVFVNGNNMPSLKAPTDDQTSKGGLVGLWVGGDSESLVADLKYIQTKKRDFE